MCGWSDQQYKSCLCVYEVESFERCIELSNEREKLGKSYWFFWFVLLGFVIDLLLLFLLRPYLWFFQRFFLLSGYVFFEKRFFLLSIFEIYGSSCQFFGEGGQIYKFWSLKYIFCVNIYEKNSRFTRSTYTVLPSSPLR